MGQKAKSGGTITLAKIGYLNVGEEYDGHEVRTVAVDPERGPLITKLFELYATGQYTGPRAHEYITAAGLRTRGSKRHPGGTPISMGQVYEILASRYYLGKIEYDGIEYDGRHPALTTPEIFDRVQRVLALRGGNGTRTRKHDHHLKGLIWCAACGHRYVIMRGKSANGEEYFYFFCRGRQKKICSQPYLPIADVERAVEQHYATVRLDAGFQTALRAQLDDLLKDELGSLRGLKQRLTARLTELEGNEDRYLDLVGDPDWPQAKIKQKLAAIRREQEEITRQLAEAGSKLEVGRQFFLQALDLLRDPQACYERAARYPTIRHALNKVIFERLYLGQDGVKAHQLAPGFTELLALRQADPTYQRRERTLPDTRCTAREDTPATAHTNNSPTPLPALADRSWSRADLVGVTGFEPAASSSRTKRATKLRHTPMVRAECIGPRGSPTQAVRGCGGPG